MRNAPYGSHSGERLRLYCAGILIQVAKSVLSLTYLLFKLRIISVTGVECGVRASETMRRLSWRLIRWKPR
jgi:hypothetical protein